MPEGYPDGPYSILGKLDGARKMGRGGKEKEWVDYVEKDICAFGISGDWEALSLQEDVWYNTVVEGGGGSWTRGGG